MKNFYTTLVLAITTFLCTAQGYNLGIVHISNNDFKIVAIPDFTDNITNASDIGFTLILPAGPSDAVNAVGLLPNGTWEILPFDAAFLTGMGLGDGTKDIFQFNLPPGQNIFSHTAGEQIDLVSFQIANMPTTGELRIMLNTNPIALGAGNVLDSFYNTDLDGPGNNPTADYFSGLATGMENFMFSVLDIEEVSIIENEIKIYPNPASDFINIKTSLLLEKIELYDVLGKSVLKTKNINKIPVNSLSKGMYILKIYSGNKSISKKVIIE